MLFSVVGYSQTFNNLDEAYGVLIVNSIKYVQWENIDGDFDILIINHPVIAQYMKKFYINKLINGKRVNVIEDKNNRYDFTGIELLISSRKFAIQSNLLTINLGEINGIINLVPEGEKVKFKIRKHDAELNKLKISNSLTSIAQVIDNRIVETKPDSIQQ